MRYFITLLLGFIMLGASANDITFANERLNYKVMYKWGLIQKQAGTASLTITNQNDMYVTKLTARTDPWADPIYTVRDTLNGRIKKQGFLPMFYEKIAHEGNDYKHDIVKYSRSGNKVYGYCTRVERDIKDNSGFKKEHIISGTGSTVDMLSVFYYMRSVNYAKMKKGEEMKLNIFSGKYKELLTIKYLGTVTLEHEGKKHTCYHITFTFTQKGNKKTSDDMWAWISTDAQRIPIKLEGTLAIGKVQCFFTGKN